MEERTTPAGTSHDGREIRKFWLMGGALVLTVLLAVLLAARPADANPRIKVSGCDVYGPNTFDPIARTQHSHFHFGNRRTSNTSTGEQLLRDGPTYGSTCNEQWFTSGAWFPEASVPLVSKNQVAVYYRAPGDQKQVQDIPTGLGIVSHEVYLNSGGSTVTVTFPDCWDGNMASLNNGPANMVKSRNGVCPSTHKYRIPRIFYLIRYNGTITNRTTVSSDNGEWPLFGSEMHADYLAANQPVFNDRLIDLCLRNAPDSVTSAHPDCG
jgi:hypothetical protein